MPSTVWIQFVKIPRLGRVKTRLAAGIGDEAALRAHKTLARAVNRQLSENIGTLQQSSDSVSLWLALGGEEEEYAEGVAVYKSLGLEFDRSFLQAGEDLGARMHSALNEALALAERAVIVGSDFPVLDSVYLEQALSLLETKDVVLGATQDGGYGLIGVKRSKNSAESPFTGFGSVEWGTSSVRAQTASNFEAQGLKVGGLAERFDVDDETDWKRWQASAWYC